MGQGGCRSTGAPFLLYVQCCAAGLLLGMERADVRARLSGSNQVLPDKRHIQRAIRHLLPKYLLSR